MSWRRAKKQSRLRRQRPASPGLAQPSNFSYRARRALKDSDGGRQPETAGLKAASLKAGRFWLQRFGLILLLLAALASAVNILSLSGNAEILPLASGQPIFELHSQAEYQTAANSLLATSIWNRNKVTVDTGNLSRHLLAQFPELATASVTIPLLAHRPIVYIALAQPALILDAQNGAYVLSDSGKVLINAANSAALQQPNLPVVTDQSGLKLQLNHQGLPADNVSFIQTVVAQLAAKQLTVSTMTLPAAASELDVQLAGQAYSIKFNLESNDARQQVGTFIATINQLKSQNVTPAKYVDVRVDGRAYYQ